MVSEPLPALLKDVPELTGLVPASSQAELASVLQKAGENVRAFFGNFQNTVSLEKIHEERLGRDGKVKDSLDERFQYLLLSHPEEQRLGLEEFRTDFRGDRKAPTGLSSGLMVRPGSPRLAYCFIRHIKLASPSAIWASSVSARACATWSLLHRIPNGHGWWSGSMPMVDPS